ncbi:hypothetical protein Tco_0029792, partial [Tanacetum coccineum]
MILENVNNNVVELVGTDISEITRKPSKTSKHGHENGRVNKSRKPKLEKVKPPVNLGQQKSITKD